MTARLTAYLNELGLAQYRRLLESNQVTMPILRSLSDESLALIGITNEEHRQSLVCGKKATHEVNQAKEYAQSGTSSEAIRFQTVVTNSASITGSSDGLKVSVTDHHVKAGPSVFALRDVRAASVLSNEDWTNSQNAKLERGSTIVRWIGLVLLILDVFAIYYWQDIPKFFHEHIGVFVWSWVPPVLLTLIGLPMISDRPIRLHESSFAVVLSCHQEENLLWTQDPDQADDIAAAINKSLV